MQLLGVKPEEKSSIFTPPTLTQDQIDDAALKESAALNQKIIGDVAKIVGKDDKLKGQENNIARGLYELHKENPAEYDNHVQAVVKRGDVQGIEQSLGLGLVQVAPDMARAVFKNAPSNAEQKVAGAENG